MFVSHGLCTCRGHTEATGGSVPSDIFPTLLIALGFSEQGLAGGNSKKRKVDGSSTGDASVSNGGNGAGGKEAAEGNGRDAKQPKVTDFFKQKKAGAAVVGVKHKVK